MITWKAGIISPILQRGKLRSTEVVIKWLAQHYSNRWSWDLNPDSLATKPVPSPTGSASPQTAPCCSLSPEPGLGRYLLLPTLLVLGAPTAKGRNPWSLNTLAFRVANIY